MRQIASLPGFISVCFRISGFLLLYCICYDGPRAISQDRVIIEACKASVALVETGDRRVATAFCIDPVGIFVTNYHVVEEVEPGASVKLVMRSSETDEWSFSAEVIRFSLTNDLAILKAINIPSDKKLTSLELSRDPKIYETMDVIAFGFPFGKQLAVDKETNPSISVNVGKITAIRKENGTIELIQLDAVLNPGNSGGPVVDTSGKAVGIVSFGVLASGVNFAIPIEKLWSLIDPPLYRIDASGLLLDPYVPSQVRVNLISMQMELPQLAVEIWCNGSISGAQKFSLKPIGGNVFQSDVSVSGADPTKTGLRVRFVLKDGQAQGVIANEKMSLAGKEYWLSSIESMRRSEDGKNCSILFKDGKSLSIDPATLPAVKINFGEFSASIPLSKAVYAEFKLDKLEQFVFNLVVKSGDKIVIEKQIDESDVEADNSTNKINNGAINPLNIDLKAQSIRQRPKYSGKEKNIQLPGELTNLERAGGGRFLLVTIGGMSNLVIIDLDQAEIVKTIPLSSPNALVSGTMEHFLVADSTKKTLQRYSLETLEVDAIGSLPTEGEVRSMTSGEASNGPILLTCVKGNEKSFSESWLLVDLKRLKPIPFEYEGLTKYLRGSLNTDANPNIRASPNGDTFVTWKTDSSPSGMTVATYSDRCFKVNYLHKTCGYLVPTADAMHILTQECGVFTHSLNGIGLKEGLPLLFPTSHPSIYLSGPNLSDLTSDDRNKLKDARVQVYRIGSTTPLATLPQSGLEDSLGIRGRPVELLDKRLYLDVEAGMMISIPKSNKQVIIQPFDLQEKMNETAEDYLVVGILENLKFTPGSRYQAQIKVETSRPEIEYKLVSGPSGMRVFPKGQILWEVSEQFKKEEVDFLVSVESKGVHQAYGIFRLVSVKGR